MVFPTYYLVYVCINLDLGGKTYPKLLKLLLIIDGCVYTAPFRIVGSLGKAQVFCSSESFFESKETSTTFCTISGMSIYD